MNHLGETEVRHDSPVIAYANRLLEVFHLEDKQIQDSHDTISTISSHRPVSRSLGLVESLSERETEILRLITAGNSRQVIVDTLVIAVSTVKKHINNLYGKLDVHSRIQTLVRARALNLLVMSPLHLRLPVGGLGQVVTGNR